MRLLKFFNIKSNKVLNHILGFMDDTSIFHLYQKLTPDQIIQILDSFVNKVISDMKRYMSPELSFELIMATIFNDDYLFPRSKQYQVMEKFLRQVMNESQTFFSD